MVAVRAHDVKYEDRSVFKLIKRFRLIIKSNDDLSGSVD
jgi:hypothetical protein